MTRAIWITVAIGWGCSSPEAQFFEPADSAIDSGFADAGLDAAADAAVDATADPVDTGADAAVDSGADAAVDSGADATADPVDAMAEPEVQGITCDRIDDEGERTDRWVLDVEQRPIFHEQDVSLASVAGGPPEDEHRVRDWTYDADGNMIEERERFGQPGRHSAVVQTWVDGLRVRRDETGEWDGRMRRVSIVYGYEARRLARETWRDSDDVVVTDQAFVYDMQGRLLRQTSDSAPIDGEPELIYDWTYPEPGLEVYAIRGGADAPVHIRGSARRDAQGRAIETRIDWDADGVSNDTHRYRFEGTLLVWHESGAGDPDADGYMGQVATFTYTPTRKTKWIDGEVAAQTDCSAPIDFNRLEAP